MENATFPGINLVSSKMPDMPKKNSYSRNLNGLKNQMEWDASFQRNRVLVLVISEAKARSKRLARAEVS
jgi:hypothetical protein